MAQPPPLSLLLMARFRYPHRVSYAECTLGDHVYYGRYLDLLERARGECFRQLGTTFLQWQQQDTIFPVIELRVRYKAPARYDDVLNIETWISLAEKMRLNFGYRLVNQNDILIVEAETLHICTNVVGKPKRLPEALIDTLKS
jgi:acyl-CoA thioester hydrolase